MGIEQDTANKGNYLLDNMTSSTYTVRPRKYSQDRIEDEIMEFVRYASSDKEALYNLRIELKEYDRRKTAWQCFKMFLVKL